MGRRGGRLSSGVAIAEPPRSPLCRAPCRALLRRAMAVGRASGRRWRSYHTMMGLAQLSGASKAAGGRVAAPADHMAPVRRRPAARFRAARVLCSGCFLGHGVPPTDPIVPCAFLGRSWTCMAHS